MAPNHAARIALLVVGIFGAVSCGDNPVAPRHDVFPTATLAPGDGGTNPDDTFLTADITLAMSSTISASEPIYDPNSGGMASSVTLTAEPVSLSVDAGYDYQGNSHINLYFNENEPDAPSDRVAVVRSNADSYSEYTAAGSPLGSTPVDPDPMGTFSTDTGSVLAGIISNSDPGGGSGGQTCPPNCEMDLLPPIRTGSGPTVSTKVLRPDNTHIQITTVTAARGLAPTTNSTAPSLVHASANPAPAGTDENPPGRMVHVRSYEKVADRWVLRRSQTDIDGPPGSTSAHHRIVMNVSNVHWQENKAKEAQRDVERERKRRAGAAQPQGAGDRQVPILHVSRMVAVEDVTGGFFAPSAPSAPDPDGGHGQDGTATYDTVVHGVPGNTPIVLQHGFASSAQTWDGMMSHLRNETNAGDLIAMSLDWKQTYETQAAELHRRLRDETSVGQTPVILVGHSNGGMVARYLGLHPDAATDRAPLNVLGVVTIGTPHEGAPIANVGRSVQVVFDAIRTAGTAICPSVNNAACNLVRDVALSKLDNLVNDYGSTGLPVLQESATNTNYHQLFDQNVETTPHYSIQSYSWKRWRPWGLAGDMRVGCLPDGPCGGRNWVKTTDRTYHRMITASIFGAVYGYFTGTWWPFGVALGSTAALKAVDVYWDRTTSPGEDASDGLVPGTSQQYPNTPTQFQYPIGDGDSHTGETHSRLTAVTLKQVLNQRFGIQITAP